MQFYPSLPTFADDNCPWLDRLIAWASVCSGKDSREGRLFLLEEAARLFKDLGASLEILENESDAPMLVARLFPKAPKKILLFGHLDTVFGKNHPFQTVSRDTEKLKGPGVCDMKSGVLILYESLKKHLKEGLRQSLNQSSGQESNLGFTIVLNTDEEIGSIISGPLWKNLAPGHFCALGFEPAFSSKEHPRALVTARMGSCNLVVSFKGKSAHAGRNPQEGASAIHAACRWWSELESKTTHIKGLFVNVGKIEGGTASNVVADFAKLEINIRAKTQEVLDQFLKIAQGTSTTYLPPLHVDLEIKSQRPAKPANASSLELAFLTKQLASDLHINLSLVETAGVCDGNNIQALGIPTLDNLGAVGGGLHSDQEWIELSSIDEQIALVSALLERLASLTKL